VRLHVLSDLHLERGHPDVPKSDADVVVLAGDICNGTDGVEWARRWGDGRPVLYVAGNHEYYGHSLPALNTDLRRAAVGSAVHVLENDEVILGGVRFLGCTLWSDFDFDGPARRALAMRICERAVADYRVIRNDDRALTAADTRAMHLDSRRWLEQRLDAHHEGPTVVITHHAPYIHRRPPDQVWRLIAGAFVSDLSALMGGERVAAWIYGHTHRVADRDVEGTRIVSNPRGYPDERVDGFDPELVVCVGDRVSGCTPRGSARA
jgi:predicted phosphodiesterase